MCSVGSEKEEVGKECHFNYLIVSISWFGFPPLIPFFFKGVGVCTHAQMCETIPSLYSNIYSLTPAGLFVKQCNSSSPFTEAASRPGLQ